MLEIVRDAEVYKELKGSTFYVGVPPYRETAEIQLKSVTERGDEKSGMRSMSLLFTGEPGRVIQQGTFCLTHDELPAQFLLMVPIQQTAAACHYEIVIDTTPWKAGDPPAPQKEGHHL